MYIFWKWRFIFCALILLEIIKALAKCIFSAVIEVCNGLERVLKFDENSSLPLNVLPKMKTNSMNNHGLNSTRSKTSNSVNRNIKPISVRLLISKLPSRKKFNVKHINRFKVAADFSGLTYDDLKNFQNMELTVKSTESIVSLKLDRNFNGKILKSSTPSYKRSKTSLVRKPQRKTNSNRILPDRKPSVQNVGQELIHNFCNASAENTSLKLDASNKVHKLKLNDPNRSENKFSEEVSLIFPEQNVKHGHKSPSANAVGLRNRNVYKENKKPQSSKKRSSIDSEGHYEMVTAIHSASQRDVDESKIQNSIHDEYHSELVTTTTHSASQHDDDDDIDSENQNSIHDKCHSESFTAMHSASQRDDKSKNQNSIHDEYHSELVTTMQSASQHDDNDGKNQNSIHDECHSELVATMHSASERDGNKSDSQNSTKDESHFELLAALQNICQLHNDANVCEIHVDDFEKSNPSKEIDCNKIKQVGEIKKRKLNSPIVNAQVDDCLWKTLRGEFIEHLDQHTNGKNPEYHLILDKAIRNAFHRADCHSELVPAFHNTAQCDNNANKNESFTNDGCYSELVTAKHNSSQCDNESEKPNLVPEKCSELVTDIRKAFKLQNNEKQLGESEKNGHIKGEKCIDVKQVAKTTEEISIPFTFGDVAPCLKAIGYKGACSNEVVLPSDVNTTPKKSDDHCSKNLTVDDDTFKLLSQKTYLDQIVRGAINTESHLAENYYKEENISLSLNETLSLIGKPAYISFLRVINPILQGIETDLLNLSKAHYCKSLITEDEFKPVELKLKDIALKSSQANTNPYHNLITNYTTAIIDLKEYIQTRIQKSLGKAFYTKRSNFLKFVTGTLTDRRKILFYANEEAIDLQKQIQKIGKATTKKRKRKRK